MFRMCILCLAKLAYTTLSLEIYKHYAWHENHRHSLTVFILLFLQMENENEALVHPLDQKKEVPITL